MHNTLNSGILRGVGPEIDKWLDRHLRPGWRVGCSPHFQHLTTWNILTDDSESLTNGCTCRDLIESIYVCIENNRREVQEQRTPSQENWRWQPRPGVDPKNTSPEVTLERAIVGAFAQDSVTGWSNQIPVVSGVLGSASDKGRHVDLARRHLDSNVYDLIELKVGSGSPLFAALELLCYGVLYIHSRVHREDFHYTREANPVLWADGVHLLVLAPWRFYFPDERNTRVVGALGWLEDEIDCGIREFAESHLRDAPLGLIDFRYWTFDKGFEWMPANTTREAVRSAIGRVQRVA